MALDIMTFAPIPAARHPELVGRGRRAGRLDFKGRRRGGKIFDFRLGIRRERFPKTGDPFPAAVHLQPVARHPISARRRVAPAAADPDEVIAVLVPRPVAGHPDDVCAGGFFGGRHFLNRRRRRLRHDERRLRVGGNRFGEGFVNGAAGEQLAARRQFRRRHGGRRCPNPASGRKQSGDRPAAPARLARVRHKNGRGLVFILFSYFVSMSTKVKRLSGIVEQPAGEAKERKADHSSDKRKSFRAPARMSPFQTQYFKTPRRYLSVAWGAFTPLNG